MAKGLKQNKSIQTDSEKAPQKAPAAVIAEVLRGPVVDVFLEHVPAFHGLDRNQAFELVMNNPPLIEECFKLFRKRPDLFEELIVGPDGKPISDETQELACGRSVAEVVALVVRSAAKRHFYKRLGAPQPVSITVGPPARSRWQRLLQSLMLIPPPPPEPKQKRKATRADRLYRAIHSSLLYEWQLPLIQHYAPLPVSMVRELGARILDYREPTELKVLLTEGVKPAATPPVTPSPMPSKQTAASVPAATSPARTIPLPASGGGGGGGGNPSSRAETLWKLSQSLQLHKTFEIDERDLRRVVAQISALGDRTYANLIAIGLKMREILVVLCAINRRLGHARTSALLSAEADPKFLEQLTALMTQEGMASLQDIVEIRESTESILSHMKKLGQL